MFLHKKASNLLQSDISDLLKLRQVKNKNFIIKRSPYLLTCYFVGWFWNHVGLKKRSSSAQQHYYTSLAWRQHTLFSHFWSENHTHKIESIRIALFTKYSENGNFLFCFLQSNQSFASSSGVGPPWSRMGDSNFLYYWFSGSNFNIANLALHDLALGTLE